MTDTQDYTKVIIMKTLFSIATIILILSVPLNADTAGISTIAYTAPALDVYLATGRAMVNKKVTSISLVRKRDYTWKITINYK